MEWEHRRNGMKATMSHGLDSIPLARHVSSASLKAIYTFEPTKGAGGREAIWRYVDNYKSS